MEAIQYKIISMDVKEFALLVDNYDKDKGGFGIGNSFSFGINLESNLLLCKHDLTLKQGDKTFLLIQLETLFNLSLDSVEKLKSNDQLVIPEGFLVQCASLSYGTMRGIVLMKAKEKGLDNIILPAMYMREIINEPMVVNLKEK